MTAPLYLSASERLKTVLSASGRLKTVFKQGVLGMEQCGILTGRAMAYDDDLVDHHSNEEIENFDMRGDQVPINNAADAENIAKRNKLSSHIDAKLRALCPIAPAGKICKVPELVRNVNPTAYEPHILAIGPYHRSKNQLSAMEEHKLRYLKHLLERKREKNTNKYVSVMWELKEAACACYVDSVALEDDEFVEMMLLDTCFIIELFRKRIGTIQGEIDDPLLKRGWMACNVVRDLLLVENQLPFFLLQKFFDMTKMSNEKSLCHSSFEFFDGFRSLKPDPVLKDIERYCIQPPKHLQGLLHMGWMHHDSTIDCMDVKAENNRGFICSKIDRCIKVPEVIGKCSSLLSKSQSGNVTEENNRGFICSWCHSCSQVNNNRASKIHNWIRKWFNYLCSKIDSRNDGEDYERISIDCATQLKEAGIKFKKGKGDHLLAVKFKDGIMEIPTLLIEDTSESYFRNLVAYEQLHQDPTMHYVTDYIRLMDCLVNTSSDVELLCQCGIIDNWLGDDEILANMFNRLSHYVMFSPEDYKYIEIIKEVNQHCNRRWNKWKANLMHNYFNTPWALISFFAALLLLLLTATQTVFSVLAYIKQK